MQMWHGCRITLRVRRFGTGIDGFVSNPLFFLTHLFLFRAVPLIIAASCMRIGSLCAQSALPAAGIPGKPWVGELGVTETMEQITARDRKNKNWVPHSKPALVPGPVAQGIAQASDKHTSTPSKGLPRPLAPQVVSSINYLAASLPECSGFPPDTMGSAGPTQFIISLNGRIRSFIKAMGGRDNAMNVTSDSFFTSVMTPPVIKNFSSDPRIRYDRLSDRWFIDMIDVPGSQGTAPNRIMIAMSDSGTIRASTVWTFFQFQHDQAGPTPNLDTGAFADYPTLAIDANAHYIGVNVFTSATNFLNT